MTIDIDATHHDGAIHPNAPLNLPNNTPVRVHVVTKPDSLPQTEEEALAVRPPAPRISVEELRERLAKYAVSVQPLPPTSHGPIFIEITIDGGGTGRFDRCRQAQPRPRGGRRDS